MEISTNPSSSSSKTERKIIERNRRTQMKTLYAKLNSLVPYQSSEGVKSLTDRLDEASKYIKKLQTMLEKMKEMKTSLMRNDDQKLKASMRNGGMEGLRSAQVEIHEKGSDLEIVLVTGLDSQLIFNETIRLIHEEGAEIVNANFSYVDHTVFHVIHSKIGELTPPYAATRISERIKKLVHYTNAS